jgi:hypothetical protein
MHLYASLAIETLRAHLCHGQKLVIYIIAFSSLVACKLRRFSSPLSPIFNFPPPSPLVKIPKHSREYQSDSDTEPDTSGVPEGFIREVHWQTRRAFLLARFHSRSAIYKAAQEAWTSKGNRVHTRYEKLCSKLISSLMSKTRRA